MLSYILCLLYFILLIKDTKKYIIILAPMEWIFCNSIELFVIGPARFDLITITKLISIIIYFIKYNSKRYFPYKYGFYIFFTSVFVSFFIGSYRGMVFIFNNILDIIYIYILYSVLNSRRYINLFVKIYIYSAIFVCIYSIIPPLTGHNFINDYFANNSEIAATSSSLTNAKRFGFYRLQSLFPHSTTFGGYCAITTFFFSLFIIIKLKWISYFKYMNVLVVLVAICGILSLSRSTIFTILLEFMFIIILLLYRGTSKRNILILLFAIIFITPVIGSIFKDSFLSLSDNSNAGGSSVEMREKQLESSLYWTRHNLIFGNGLSYASDIIGKDQDLWGLESVWLTLIIERGYFGVITYILMFMCFIIVSPKGNRIYILFFIITWLILNTMTSIPGLKVSFIITLIMISNKLYYLTKYNNKTHEF